jgi:hypothetical protein
MTADAHPAVTADASALQAKISPELVAALDGIEFGAIASYLCRRAGLTVGRRELHLKVRDGWFERAYDRAPLHVR